jgi:diguanylate cyclase (GGDEF)-like protein
VSLVRAESLRPGFVHAVLIMIATLLATALIDLYLEDGLVRIVQPLMWTGLAGLFGLAAEAVRWRRVPLAAMPQVVGILVVAHSLVTVAALAVAQDRDRVLSVIFAVFVAGGVLTGVRWMLANDAVCIAGLLVALAFDTAGVFADVLMPLGYTLVIAHLVHAMRLRGLSQIERLAGELTTQAGTDAMTGLLNRRGLAQAAREMVAGSRRPLDLGVLWLDLDGFKKINDDLGHAAGDAVLVEVAERLRRLVRADDIVARAGGDEFVVLIPGVTVTDLEHTAIRVGMQLRGHVGVLGVPWATSVGTAHGPAGDAGAVDALLHGADLAMFTQKQQRREAGAAPVR